MRFLHKMPKFIETALQSYKNSKGQHAPSGDNNQSKKRKQVRSEGSRKVTAMTAQIAEDRIRPGPQVDSLDDWEWLTVMEFLV